MAHGIGRRGCVGMGPGPRPCKVGVIHRGRSDRPPAAGHGDLLLLAALSAPGGPTARRLGRVRAHELATIRGGAHGRAGPGGERAVAHGGEPVDGIRPPRVHAQRVSPDARRVTRESRRPVDSGEESPGRPGTDPCGARRAARLSPSDVTHEGSPVTIAPSDTHARSSWRTERSAGRSGYGRSYHTTYII